MSLLIKNGKAFINGELIEKNIFINNGKIKKILPKNKTTRTDNIIDAKNKIILPGLIDCHVHFREPGLTHKGDFFTESRAAAKGGVTTILDMPNTIPPTITAKLLEQKRNLASKSVVNYGFHFGASVGKINEVKKAKNIASVKLYMDYTTGDLKIDDHDYIVDVIATDHAPHLMEEKENPEYPFGVPGLETMLPLLLDAFNNKQIGLKKIVELCAENPSRIFRIKNKGYIKERFDADLTVV